ncbi:MAG TPA: tetratricopeptide repeat protein [Candidatus Acidoferrum sp.]|nr:tetratricopeptide repeat protein [Candidatus Acidoferrum sp.]
MILRISLPAARLLLLFALFLAFFLVYFSIRNARATHAVELNTRAGYEQAVRLEPGSAYNWLQLGRFYQTDFEQANPAASRRALLAARRLDPLSSDVLLELATNYDEAGSVDDARSAFLEAKRVYPLSAEVRWSYGNFLLRQREIPAAFAEIHAALQLDPKRSAEAFSRCHRFVADDADILDKVIPQNIDAYLDIIHDLTSANQLNDALAVWNRATALPDSLNLIDVTVFVNSLMQSGRTGEAGRVWQQATAKMKSPPTPDAFGSVLWDGGFESGFHFGGLGWQFDSGRKGVQVSFDRKEKHSGSQSLELVFTGHSNLQYSDVCHWVPVEPGKTYRFSAWIQTKALTSDEGLRFSLYSRSQANSLVALTSEVHGDAPWTNVELLWKAAADTDQLLICAARSQSGSSDGDIAGAAWIDDVTLIPAPDAPNR